MKRTILRSIIIFNILLSSFSYGVADELVIYNAPEGVDAANDFLLEVNGLKAHLQFTMETGQ